MESVSNGICKFLYELSLAVITIVPILYNIYQRSIADDFLLS